ncbi:MAG: hypothetical protein M1820_001654 [Bogoriella megaspora]|nr:MAG: hypothetical protein M1820_001654 [Bogoriella megaspora]
MPLTLLPMTEADLPNFTRISEAAFASDFLNPYIWPNGRLPSDNAMLDAQHAKELRDDPNTYFLHVVDTSTNTSIACAQWIYMPPRSASELAKPISLPEFAPSSNHEVMKFVFEGFLRARDEIMGGKEFWMLAVLVTHPEGQRRGAGGMLLDWGIERAERDGLECYLEASKMGRPLYEKFGWEGVRDQRYDVSRWAGKEAEHRSTCMVRKPRGGRGESK